MFLKIGVLENFTKFTGKCLCWSLFWIKLQRLQHRCFPMKLVNFLRTIFPVDISNITTYLKYTFPYLLNDLVYPLNSAYHVQIFPMIFTCLYSYIWTSVSSLLFQWLKNIFFIPPFSRSYLPIFYWFNIKCSSWRVSLADSILRKLCKTQLAKTSFAAVSGTMAIKVEKFRNLSARIPNRFSNMRPARFT